METFEQRTADSVKVTEKKNKKPINFKSGLSLFDPFKVQKNEREIFSILEEHFGEEDGSYFVVADSIFTRCVNGDKSRFKVIKVEDKNHYRYMLWFDITNLSFILNVL